MMNLSALPGSELVQQGIEDLGAGKKTIAALLVCIGYPRLKDAGLSLPDEPIPDPEHRLYKRLARTSPNSAHSVYNALIRRLVSFERALECAN